MLGLGLARDHRHVPRDRSCLGRSVATPRVSKDLLTEHWHSGHGAAFAANAVALVVFSPLSEELFVRGLGFGLFRPIGRGISIVAPADRLGADARATRGDLSARGLRDRTRLTCASARIVSIPGMFVHGLFNAHGARASLRSSNCSADSALSLDRSARLSCAAMRLPSASCDVALAAVPLGAAAPARAASCSANASAVSGPAPLTVTFDAAL